MKLEGSMAHTWFWCLFGVGTGVRMWRAPRRKEKELPLQGDQRLGKLYYRCPVFGVHPVGHGCEDAPLPAPAIASGREQSRHPMDMGPKDTRTNIFGVAVSAINMDDAIERIDRWIEQRTPNYICITGAHGVMESRKDFRLRDIHNQAGLVTPDGGT